MNIQAIKRELRTLGMTELEAIKNLFEFNLRGLLIGNRREIIRKLKLVNAEIEFRQNFH